MAKRKAIEIAFVSLKPGIHSFSYEINEDFFEGYDNRDFSNCHSIVKLNLDKQTGFMLLKFEIGGKAEVVCDRCGNNLEMDLWDEFNMVVKMVDNPEEMNDNEEDPDVFYISRTESHLHLNEWIYEFVSLSVPMQKKCADEAMGGPQCNVEVLEKIREMEANAQKGGENDIWKGLDKFKN
jgi:uncharacterized metal-binding protein YceD (DUF177 family)